jgi:plastocyanin
VGQPTVNDRGTHSSGSLLIKSGTTVSFINNSPSEVHNMVFTGRVQPDGSSPAEEFAQKHQEQTDLLPFGPENQVMPDFVYGSQPQAAPAVFDYTGDEYGNGFLSTELMDARPGDPPNGLFTTERITFSKAGKYHYYCAIHGKSMSGTVTVQ